MNRNYEKLFINLCKWNYFDDAKNLIKLNPNIDISIDNEYAFRFACHNKRINIAKWLVELNPNKYYVKIIDNKIVDYKIKINLPILNNKQIILSQTDDKICPVCLDNQIELQTNCKHNFCVKCCDQFYTVNKICPYCRTNITQFYKIS